MATKNYCLYEPYTPKIESMRVMIVDCLLKTEDDISLTALDEPGFNPLKWLREERHIAGLALENITQNVLKMIKRNGAIVKIIHISDFTEKNIDLFNPDAIILSGTLRDFDLYSQTLLNNFARTIQKVKTPILGICGGHQLICMSYGAHIVTLDHLDPREKRGGRIREYEYHFMRVTRPKDPIFAGLDDENSRFWKGDGRQVIRIWQNHSLMSDRIPEGFTNLAKSYLCPVQMLVKRTDQQLIYTVQYHLEKSFEDWNKLPTRWEHRNDSRDGRIIFENFLIEAIKFRERQNTLSKTA